MGLVRRIWLFSTSRWVIELECGHEMWATAKKRPTRRRMKCAKCEGGRPWKRRGKAAG